MRIVNKDKNILQKLKASKLSRNMESLSRCDFFAIEEKDEQIIGAVGIGGFFNVPGMYIDERYRGKGIGGILFNELVKEAKNRGYSFLCGSRNPENCSVIKIEDKLGFYPVFRIHYAPDVTRDIVITVFTKRGILISKFLSIFNSRIGTIIIGILLKIFKSLWRSALTLSPKQFPKPSIKYMMRNFEKI